VAPNILSWRVADFVFATCLPGLEPALKLDLARARPELRLAYSRPGLLTFKSARAVAPDDPPGSVFAWAWGQSIGPLDGDPADPATRAQLAAIGASRVHAFFRDLGRDPGEAPGAADLSWLAAWQALGPGGPAEPGERVADVIVAPVAGSPRDARRGGGKGPAPPVQNGRAGPRSIDPAWLGVHRHDRGRSPHPGGAIPVVVPGDAPSRAYAKIEEAIAWAGLGVAAGQVALEIGAAPGGAALALARRGLEVWAVDTGALAPQVAALPSIHHLAKKVGALRWEELPAHIDWLLVDVNLAPQVALHEVRRLMPRLVGTLRGAVLTLKLNDWSFVAELPALVDRIRQMGLADVRLRHLPSNRREVCAVALSA
jgi:23S rRNA (cytidine2498-2'-O)-methyltransferase